LYKDREKQVLEDMILQVHRKSDPWHGKRRMGEWENGRGGAQKTRRPGDQKTSPDAKGQGLRFAPKDQETSSPADLKTHN
jgi:hypothetical protein